MRLFHRNRARVNGPRMIFEELEERIVLDASVDPMIQENPFSGSDIHHDFAQEAVKPHSAGAGFDHSTQAAPAAAASNQDLNVVLISDQLPDLATFKQAASEHAKVIVYSEARDNLDSINAALHQLVESSGKKIDHVALLSHAARDQVWIGSDKLNMISAATHRADFETLGQQLADRAQIHLYGCDTAADPFGQALVDRVALYTHADVFASANKTGGPQHDWSLEYSSDPSASMVQLLNADSLQAVTTDLAPPPPTITVVPVPPVHAPANLIGPSVVDLSGAFRVADGVLDVVTVVVTANPQPDLSIGISSLTLTDVASGDLIFNDTGTTFQPQFTLTGQPDQINQVLSTMEATIRSEFSGIAKITVTATDPAHTTDAGSNPSADVPLLISVDRAPYTPQIQIPNFQTVTSGVMTTIPFPAAAEPHLRVTDSDSHQVGVIIQAFHGTVSVPTTPGVLPFGGTGLPLSATVSGPLIGLRGDLPSLWTSLHGLQYQSYPGYFGPDTVTVNVNDISYQNLRPGGLSATEPISIRVLPA